MATPVQNSVRVMSEWERRRNEDVDWAQQDPQVEQFYGGQWVVAHDKRVIAHGTDPAKVRDEAAKALGCNAEDLLVCAVPHPDSWLADA